MGTSHWWSSGVVSLIAIVALRGQGRTGSCALLYTTISVCALACPYFEGGTVIGWEIGDSFESNVDFSSSRSWFMFVGQQRIRLRGRFVNAPKARTFPTIRSARTLLVGLSPHRCRFPCDSGRTTSIVPIMDSRADHAGLHVSPCLKARQVGSDLRAVASAMTSLRGSRPTTSRTSRRFTAGAETRMEVVGDFSLCFPRGLTGIGMGIA